jgi:hypothetical protein
MSRLALALSLLALGAASLTPPAAAQDNPFGPIPPPPPQQQTVAGDPNADPFQEDEGLSRTQQLLIALSGIALLGGIAFVILRDANQAAPAASRGRDRVPDGSALDTAEQRAKGSRPPKKQRVAQGRAKAKRARQQRKKNRS